MPQRLRPVVTLFLFAVLAGGCAAAFSGVTGSTLTRTNYPPVSVTANSPFVLQAQGRELVRFDSEALSAQPSGIMDYALYAPESAGPVTRHAHALIVRPTDTRLWYFQVADSQGGNVLAANKRVINGYGWIEQILRVPAEGDWFSALWTENGREVPEMWLAKRLVTTPQSTLRVVAEYREPWPECLDPQARDLMFVSRECLQGFFQRSGDVFTLEMTALSPQTPPAAQPFANRPPFGPNMKKLAGELMRFDTMSFRR